MKALPTRWSILRAGTGRCVSFTDALSGWSLRHGRLECCRCGESEVIGRIKWAGKSSKVQIRRDDYQVRSGAFVEQPGRPMGIAVAPCVGPSALVFSPRNPG